MALRATKGVATKWCVEGTQPRTLLVELDLPEAVPHVDDTEQRFATKLRRNVLDGRYRIVFSLDGAIQIFRV